MTFEDRHPGLKGKVRYCDFDGHHEDRELAKYDDDFVYLPDIDATQLDKQKVLEVVGRLAFMQGENPQFSGKAVYEWLVKELGL